VILLGVGGWLVFRAVDNILNGAELELLGLGIAVMVLLGYRESLRLLVAYTGGSRDGLPRFGG
jgi:hypothetical protein